jgi:hypothetical protein
MAKKAKKSVKKKTGKKVSKKRATKKKVAAKKAASKKPAKKTVKKKTIKKKKSTKKKVVRKAKAAAKKTINKAKKAVSKMAKKKSSKKVAPRRARSKKSLDGLKPILAGGIGLTVANFAISKAPIPPKARGAVNLGLGIAMTMFAKNKMLQYLGIALGSMGLNNLIVSNVPMLAGDDYSPEEIEAMEDYLNEQLAGYDPEGEIFSEDQVLMGNTEVELGNTEIELGDDYYGYDDENEYGYY